MEFIIILLISDLFNVSVSSSEYIVSRVDCWIMNGSVKQLRYNLEFCLSICLERLHTEDLSQDSLYPIRDLNLGPSEYKLGVITQ
jgi:hypothetical protein